MVFEKNYEPEKMIRGDLMDIAGKIAKANAIQKKPKERVAH